MWATLISLIEKKWSESKQPRNRLAKAILLLYSNLENCHMNYKDFKSQRNYEALENWARSVHLLTESFESVEKTLQIFEVELHTILKLYSWGEFFSVYSFENEEGRTESIKYIEEALKSYLAAIEIATMITSSISEEDKVLPDMKGWNELIGIGVDSTVRLIKGAEAREDEYKQVRDRAVFTYDILLSRSGINDAQIIEKFDKNLFDIDELDFHLALNKFREWIRKEFTIEEIFANT